MLTLAIQKLEARVKVAKERDELAKKFLDAGGIILTRQEAEELLILLKRLTISKSNGLT